MSGLSGFNNFPAVGLKDFVGTGRGMAVGVDEHQARAQGHKGAVNVNGIGVAGEVQGMNAMVGEVALQPVMALAVGGENRMGVKRSLPRRIISAASNRGSYSVVTNLRSLTHSRRRLMLWESSR